MGPAFDNLSVALISGLVSPFLCIWLYAVLPFWIEDLVTARTWKTLEDPERDQRERSRASDQVASKVGTFLGGQGACLVFIQMIVYNSIFCALLTPVAFGVLWGIGPVVAVDPLVKLLVTPWGIVLGVVVTNRMVDF